jgi:hypothetical protein
VANNIAFQQMGPTVRITASTANTQGNIVEITATSPVNQYFVSNPDLNNGVFVAYGETEEVAAVIPNGEPANVIYIPAYAYKVFTGPQCSPTKTVYARIISEANNAVIFVAPGEGL